MAKSKKYKSDAFAAIHQTAAGMRDAGVIDKATMRGFDEACLKPNSPSDSPVTQQPIPD